MPWACVKELFGKSQESVEWLGVELAASGADDEYVGLMMRVFPAAKR